MLGWPRKATAPAKLTNLLGERNGFGCMAGSGLDSGMDLLTPGVLLSCLGWCLNWLDSPPPAIKIANAKAVMYSWCIRMVKMKNWWRMLSGTLSIIQVLGVRTSESITSRTTSMISNTNFLPMHYSRVSLILKLCIWLWCQREKRGQVTGRKRSTGCVSFQVFGAMQLIRRMWAFDGIWAA